MSTSAAVLHQEYNRVLARRATDPFQRVLDVASEPSQPRRGVVGHPDTYDDEWIEALLMLRAHLECSFRAVVALAGFLVRKIGADRAIPSATQLSRRNQRLGQSGKGWRRRTGMCWIDTAAIRACQMRAAKTWVLMDATGIAMKGPGCWQREKPGAPTGLKKRRYAKLHLATEAATGQVLAAVISSSRVADSVGAQQLLSALAPLRGKIRTVAADGAYDADTVYAHLELLGVNQSLIRPVSSAKVRPEPVYRLRNQIVDLATRHRVIVPGSPAWRKHTGAGVRSLIETTMHQFKTRTGTGLRTRSATGQYADMVMRLTLFNEQQRDAISPTAEHAPSVTAMLTDVLLPLPKGKTYVPKKKPRVPRPPKKPQPHNPFGPFARIHAKRAAMAAA